MDLSNSSLMKANLEGANLNCVRLTNCNLLGVNLDRAKLEKVIWDERVLQEPTWAACAGPQLYNDEERA